MDQPAHDDSPLSAPHSGDSTKGIVRSENWDVESLSSRHKCDISSINRADENGEGTTPRDEPEPTSEQKKVKKEVSLNVDQNLYNLKTNYFTEGDTLSAA